MQRTVPWGVGTSIFAPLAASPKLIGTRTQVVAAALIECVRLDVDPEARYRQRVPPRPAGPPWPQTRGFSCHPRCHGGIFTEIVSTFARRPLYAQKEISPPTAAVAKGNLDFVREIFPAPSPRQRAFAVRLRHAPRRCLNNSEKNRRVGFRSACAP